MNTLVNKVPRSVLECVNVVFDFLGIDVATHQGSWQFHKSLDAQQTAWDKLRICNAEYFWFSEGLKQRCNYTLYSMVSRQSYIGIGDTIAEASLVAVVNAIEDIKDKGMNYEA